jgi:Carbohydrate family 9 binding domain-like
MRPGLLLAILALAGCTPAPEWSKLSPGQKGDDTITGAPLAIPRAKTPPKLDGVLDDAAWSSAAKLGPFVDPGGGGEAGKSPVAALARMTWDDQNLYLGVVVHDGSPTSPFGHDDVDPHVWGAASGIELMMQPGDPGDNRDYYELQVDVNGAVFDSHFDDYNAPITGTGADKRFGHMEFDSHVQRQISKGRGYYAVELAYPWASLAPARVSVPPKPGDVWRINLYSFRDGQRHALAWSPLRGRGNFHRAERFGRVKFSD